MKFYGRYVCFAAVLFLAICSVCGKKEKAAATVAGQLDQKIDLSSVVAAKPAAIVSVLATIDLEFSTALVPQHQVGGVLDRSPFEFDPAISGHAQWLSTAAIRFTPSKPLTPGKQYKGVFKGKIALGSQRKVDNYEFSFKAAEQEILNVDGDFVPDMSGKDLVKFEGYLRFAQAVNVADVKRDLRVRVEKKSVEFALEPTEDPARLKLTSASVQRGAQQKTFLLLLPSKYTVQDGEWQREFLLPGRNVFKVISHAEITDPKDNVLAYGIRFSDPVKPNIDLSGFITVEPEVKYTVHVQGKTLKLRGDFTPGSTYNVTITEGLPSAFNTTLASPFTAEFVFANKQPKVEWISQGVLLPPDNNFKVQLKTMNVKQVRVEVTEIFSDNIGFFQQTNGIWDPKQNSGRGGSYEGDYYENEYEGGYYGGRSSFQDLERVGKQIFQKDYQLDAKKNAWFKSELDIGKYLAEKRNAAFVVRVTFTKEDLVATPTNDRESAAAGLYYDDKGYYQNPANDGFYYNNGQVQKLLVSSDIALTVKKAHDGLHVFATDVVTSAPASGLELSLMSYQNQVVDKGVTDGGGYVFFNTTEGSCIRGKNRNGLAFIQLNHPKWEINTFDVNGISDGQNNINAFLYTDRGVHRPGDTIFLCAIVRVERRPPPADQPVLLEVRNPRGQIVHTAKAASGTNGHVSFPIPTSPDDPTGAWVAYVKIADETFEHSLKVETVKPNRLKVKLDFPQSIVGENGDAQLTGAVEAKYLFGAPAADLKYRIKAYLSEREKTFAKLPGYRFDNPLKSFVAREQDIADDAKLDKSGHAGISRTINDLSSAPQAVYARLEASVFEKGGSFTQTWKSVEINPYKVYVGVKSNLPGGSGRVGEEYRLSIVAVDTAGQPVKGKVLIVKEYVNRHHWWWDYDSRDRRDFRTLTATYLTDEQSYLSGAGPVEHTFKVEDYGEHFIEVVDPSGGHSAGFFYNGYDWGGSGQADEAPVQGNLLDIHCDKNVYQPGDEAVLTFKCPSKGYALLTVEQGNRLLKKEWVEISDAEPKVKFKIEEDFVPNCYASISMVQPHKQTKNDLPMRLFGIKNLLVENAATRLPIEMTAPKELAPRQKFSVQVTSRAPAAATFTIAIVDEGLLDLTSFETPDPWSHFFRKVGLFVESFDNFNDVIGALLPDMDAYFSIGGGESMEGVRKKRLGSEKGRRFLPVVLFCKPVDLAPGKSANVDFTMPNYIGSVRCMLIASSGHSYAAREQTIPVKQALMVLPTLPRVLRPLDKFKLPVSVFAMEPRVRNVELTVTVPPEMVEIKGPAAVSLTFDGPGEKDAAFELAVKPALGSAKIRITAKSGNETAWEETEMTVGPANPFYTDVIDTVVTKGNPVQLVPRPVGLDNKATLSLKRLPDIDVHERLQYLIHYPYGCIEQTTSSVFPQLFLGDLTDLTASQKTAVNDAINAGIERLSLFIMEDRGFSFWPLSDWGKREFNDWGTSYAGHFLVEARKLGYHVPDELYDHWLSSQQHYAKTVNADNHRFQAYRLFTLALAGKPHLGGMNLLRENHLAQLDPLSKSLLAASFYLCGKKDVAANIKQYVKTEIVPYREMAGSYGSDLRDLALLAYTAEICNDAALSSKLLQELAKRFKPYGWYSTQESAFALLAIGTFFKTSSAPGGSVDYAVALPDGKQQKGVLKGCQLLLPLNDAWGKPLSVTTAGNNPLFVSLLSEGIPLESTIKNASAGIQLTRNF
jgi:alpha-2-macroglobulin